MQVALKPEEKETLIAITKPLGRVKWFTEKAKITRHTLRRLIVVGMVDESVMKKVRRALNSKEAVELIDADKQVAVA